MLGIQVSEKGAALFRDTPRPEREKKGVSLLEFPNSYVVIDLETTGLDPSHDKIIELAGIKFENNIEVGRFQSLVRAEVDDYITDLTGITNDMLRDAPEIDEVLPHFLSFVGDNTVIGHNVNFDVNFIYDNAQDLSLAPFSNNFVDTMQISRRLYKDLPNNKLSTLCSSLNIPQPIEHRALADCQRAFFCYKAMKQHVESEGIPLFTSWQDYSPPSKTIHVQSEFFNPDGPVYQKAFVFTGVLNKMTRQEAMQAVVDCGGICQDRVTKKTDYLVVGNNDYCTSIMDRKSTKQKYAEKLRHQGFDISVISENVFYDMLHDSALPSASEEITSSNQRIVKAEQMTLFDGPINTEEEIHAAFEPALIKVLSENNILPHHLSFARKKTYSSCTYKASKTDEREDIRGGIIYRVRMRGDSNYIAVKNNFAEYIPAGIHFKSGSDGYTKIFVNGIEEALQLTSLLTRILNSAIDSAPKEFDCCSRYEECSLAKKCVHPNPEFSLNCSYKFKLKKGVVFFGPNRTID